MSRGPGRIQQMILDLIASDPHGAWTVGQICERVYPHELRVLKKHRVAVTRALRRMELPGTWDIRQMSKKGGEYCLGDKCDEESTLRRIYFGIGGPMGFAAWKQNHDRSSFWIEHARKSALKARLYRDASPIGKLDIEIADVKEDDNRLRMLGASPAAFAANKQRIAELIEKKKP
jgi:hypothetical protein